MCMASSAAPMNKIERAHQMYREGRYEEALGFYTDALAMAKTKPQKIALHSNRAACFLKLHHFNKAAEECTSVLELDHNHTGALMLRAQTLVTLKEYHSALFDVNRLMELNPSSEVYRNLHARLKTQMESHLLQYLKLRQSLKKRMKTLKRQNQQKMKKKNKKKKIWYFQKWKEIKTMSMEGLPLVLKLFLPKLRAPRDHLNKIRQDGKLFQNQKDTHNLTTQGGTELTTIPVKMMMMKTMMRSPSLDIGSV